jgi:outer membrane protein OmpA-like peptidoglycan-associated protein
VTVGQNGTGTVSADCALPGRLMDSCTIVLTATVNGRTVVIGTGRLTSPGGGSSGGEIVITMTPVGNRLMHRPGGVTVTAVATITPHGTAAVQRTSRASLRAKALLVPVVHFATASAVVPASAVKSLKALRGKLLAAGASAVTCAGHTDARDTAAYNRSLGLSRARTVCAILTKGTAVRAVTLSFGPSHPVASNATPAGRAANRRVTLQLTY